MNKQRDNTILAPLVTRRGALQAGAIGMGLGLSELTALRSMASDGQPAKAKSVLFIFLTGGLSHHDSFDMKPDAPDDIRGEFQPIATDTPGFGIDETPEELGRNLMLPPWFEARREELEARLPRLVLPDERP